MLPTSLMSFLIELLTKAIINTQITFCPKLNLSHWSLLRIFLKKAKEEIHLPTTGWRCFSSEKSWGSRSRSCSPKSQKSQQPPEKEAFSFVIHDFPENIPYNSKNYRYQRLLEKSEKYGFLLQLACAIVVKPDHFLSFLAWDKQKPTFLTHLVTFSLEGGSDYPNQFGHKNIMG